MKIFIRISVSILISVVCLYFAARNVQFGELKNLILGAKSWPLAAGICISMISFWFRAHRWRILLRPFQDISTPVLFRWQIGGLLITNILPLRLGEIARAYWAGHKSSISKSTIFATIVIERIMDVGSIAVIGIVLLFIMGIYKGSNLFTTRNGIAFVLVVLTLALIAKFIYDRFDRHLLLAKLKGKLPERFYHILEKFLSGLKILKNKRDLAKVIIISLAIWSVDAFTIQVFSRTLSLNLSWMQAGLTIVGLVLGVMVPAAPGAAGTYEAGGVAALTLMGFPKTLSFSFILLIHSIQYLFVLCIGIPILIIEGFNPKQIFASLGGSSNNNNSDDDSENNSGQ